MSRPARRTVFDSELIEERSGFIAVLFSGTGAKKLFEHEAGGHRWMRIPLSEKKGRVHTSTITCAVMDAEESNDFHLDLKDVEIQTCRGSGKGGQHRNRTDSCVTAVHKPTGLRVRVDLRSQHQSKATALKILAARLQEQSENQATQNQACLRKQQCGSGMRGDKIRTYRTQDDRVTDHRTNRTWSLKKWLRGDWE